jgi:hypothetical protein
VRKFLWGQGAQINNRGKNPIKRGMMTSKKAGLCALFLSMAFLSACASSPDPMPDYMLSEKTNIVVGNASGSSRLGGLKLHIDDTLIGQFDVGEYIRFGLAPGTYEMRITPVVSLLGPQDKVKLRVKNTEQHAYNIGRIQPGNTGLLWTSANVEYLTAVNPEVYERELKTCCVDVSSQGQTEK